jgi:hypothetical protein
MASARVAVARLVHQPTQVIDQLLVWLPAVASATAVAAYLAVHRELVLGPGGELLAALGSGAWSPALGVHGSFALLLLAPVALLVVLAAAIWPWSRLYYRRPTLRLLATLTVASAVLVVLQIALGSAGILRTGTLAVTSAGLAAALIIGHRARRTVVPEPAPAPDTRPAVLAGGRRARLAARFELAPPTHLGIFLGGLAGASWLAVAAIAALVPPWGWDTLSYHLTDVFWFARTGALEPFPHPLHQFHFPKVAELHSLWFYLLAGGGEGAWRVTGIAQLPLALTAGVAVRAAGELLGLRSSLPWLAPATMLLPLALIQPLAGYTDLAFAAFLLAGFAFLLAARRRGRTADWALAALACGLALGSKLSFVYLGLPLVVLVAVRPTWALFRPRALLRATLCALLLAAGCGFWLIPSLLRTGNPFHPVAVTVAGKTLLDGPTVIEVEDSGRRRYTDSLVGWLVYPFHERFQGRVGYSPDNGFGPQFAAAALALPFALALAVRGRRRLLTRALLATPAMALAWLALSPWEHPRYALAAGALALLGLAAVEEAATAGAGTSPVARGLLRSAVVVALVFAVPAALLAAAPELPRVAAHWKAGEWSPSDYYPILYGPIGSAFNWLDEQGGDGTTVSFDLATFVAPLFGWHGKNRVVYAASLDERGADGLPFLTSSRSWRRFLERERVDWVVIWRPSWEGAPQPTLRQRWVAANPEGFERAATFGEQAHILAPQAVVDDAAATGSRHLAELSSGEGWILEYATGATATLAADQGGGLRVDYQFLTNRPDYLDLRFGLSEGDWPPNARLTFSLDTPGGSPLLWIYLKEADPRRSCRFRIAPRLPAAEPGLVTLDLSQPQSQTPGFSARRVASVHLVLDDGGSSRATTGSFRLHDFRLEPATGARSPAGSSVKEGP